MVLECDCTMFSLKASQGECFKFSWLMLNLEKTIKYVSIFPQNSRVRDAFFLNRYY